MKVSDFDFELPNELIASHPLERRDASRMLVVQPKISDKHIADFVSYLRPGDVVVFNNSKVIPARFDATANDGTKYEITLHTKTDDGWLGFAKKFQKLQIGEKLKLDDGTEIEILEKSDESGLGIKFYANDVFAVLDSVGKMPLPPYMKREEEISDRERYQTIYANPVGSMAAPTAGLHFTNELLDAVRGAGAEIVNITLHVGAGTWAPIKTEDTDNHKMHSEWGVITQQQADIINNAKQRGGRVIAVGTTSLRLLESAAQISCPPNREGAVAAGDWGGLEHQKPCSNFAQSMAKILRKDMTKHECILWKHLHQSPNGFNFRKQKPIGNYIVDFINIKHKLIIELDGIGHGENQQIKHDAIRDKFLQDSGYRVIRFWNDSVIKNLDSVLDTIYYYLIHDDEVPPLRNFYPKEIMVSPPQSSVAASAAETTAPSPLGGHGATVAPFCGTTNIFITPGYKFQVVDVLLTNFHLPKSTLFMLVSAFAGLPEMRAAYAHAVAEKYRFFSYGDCCLLFRKED